MNLPEFFERVEETLLARFRESGFVAHAGDKGENREEILREFLEKHLPRKYGVLKGEIITRSGDHTHSADIIIFDALNAPVLYRGKTAVLPIESVYGIIEVKSSLSKTELLDATGKIEAFKKLAPRDLSVIQTREYVTVHRPSRPFGVVLGYKLASNSLESLSQNWSDENTRIHDANYFANLIAVLGCGVIRYELVNLSRGTKELLVDTDQFVNTILTAQKRLANNEPTDEILLRIVAEAVAERTFGRLFVYLLIILERMKLSVADLGRYIDPNLPQLISRES
ncbi:MAG: DUF6602 domain-containing protein [Thermodesulfobacteriota bacterium]|jgi:hypothetical protein